MPLSIWARRHSSLLLCSLEASSFVAGTHHSGARSEITTELCSGGRGGNPHCPELRLAWDLPLHGAGCVKKFLVTLIMTSTPTSLCLLLLLPCASENTLSRAAWWNFIETSLTLRQQHFYFSFNLVTFFFSFLFGKQIQCLMLRWGFGRSFRKIILHILEVVCNNFAYAIKMLIAFEE